MPYNPKTVVRAGYGLFFSDVLPGLGGRNGARRFNLKDTLSLTGPAGIDPALYLDTGFPSPTATLGVP